MKNIYMYSFPVNCAVMSVCAASLLILRGGFTMKEKLVNLFDKLDERDQKAAFEFIQALARRKNKPAADEDVSQLFGKNFFVLPD